MRISTTAMMFQQVCLKWKGSSPAVVRIECCITYHWNSWFSKSGMGPENMHSQLALIRQSGFEDHCSMQYSIMNNIKDKLLGMWLWNVGRRQDRVRSITMPLHLYCWRTWTRLFWYQWGNLKYWKQLSQSINTKMEIHGNIKTYSAQGIWFPIYIKQNFEIWNEHFAGKEHCYSCQIKSPERGPAPWPNS